MITIALDETSGFEEHDDMTRPVYIAGIIYDDGDSASDFANETSRLIHYYERSCESVGCSYPRDMHSGNRTSGRNVARAKESVKQGLAEFFGKGTFQGEELLFEDGKPVKRAGRYYLCLILKSSGGKDDLLGDNVNVLMKDDFAGNLYVHMAEEAISRCIFHNPLIRQVKHVSFDLATRRIVLQGKDRDERAEEYIRLRYPEVPANQRVARDSREFVLVNPDVYRTAIEREMMISDRMDVKIDRFSTRSISYRDNAGDDMVFLHLADTICSALSYKLEGSTPKEWLESLDQRMLGFIGPNRYLLFAYDTVDGYFADAWERYEEKDYYKALAIAYDGMHYEGECAEYYSKVWFPRILDELQKETNSAAYTLALHKFREAVQDGRLNHDKMYFILQGLERMEGNIAFTSPEDRAVLYRFYDTAVMVLNLCGMSELAEGYAEKSRQFFGYVGVEELLHTRNKALVAKCDQFNFRAAEQEALVNLGLYEQIRQVRDILAGGKNMGWVSYARALSQMGQIQAFNRNPQAEGYFRQAMQAVGTDTKNYRIAQSYLMHYYLDNGMREKYEECAADYFETLNLKEQLTHLLAVGGMSPEGRISMRYGLYIYVRALWKFYVDELPEETIFMLGSLKEQLQEILPGGEWRQGHPWQHIFKYLAMIMQRRNMREASAVYLQAMEEILEDCEEIVKVMVYFGKAEIAELKKDTVSRNDASRKAWAEIRKISEEVKAGDCNNPGRLYEYLDEHITYTYR